MLRKLTTYKEIIQERSGQASVEFALVVCGCLVVVVGMAALWRMFSNGVAIQDMITSLGYALPYGLFDVLQY